MSLLSTLPDRAKEFVEWMEKHPDVFSNTLTTREKVILCKCYVNGERDPKKALESLSKAVPEFISSDPPEDSEEYNFRNSEEYLKWEKKNIDRELNEKDRRIAYSFFLYMEGMEDVRGLYELLDDLEHVRTHGLTPIKYS